MAEPFKQLETMVADGLLEDLEVIKCVTKCITHFNQLFE